MFIVIVCNVINLEIYLDFLSEPFYIIKESGKKCEYLKNEKR